MHDFSVASVSTFDEKERRRRLGIAYRAVISWLIPESKPTNPLDDKEDSFVAANSSGEEETAVSTDVEAM